MERRERKIPPRIATPIFAGAAVPPPVPATLIPEKTPLEQRLAEVYLSAAPGPRQNLPRFLVLAATQDWCFAHNAEEIVKGFPQYRFDVIFRPYSYPLHENYAGAYVMFWKDMDGLLAAGWPREKVVAGFASWGSWHGMPLSTITHTVRGLAGITVNCPGLRDVFMPFVAPERLFYTPDGVDTDIFTVSEKPRDPPQKVIWVGTETTWDSDLKGLALIIPAVKQAGMELKIVSRERAKKEIGRSYNLREMVQFYQDADICVIASAMEGTPNPALEAAACGLPLATTPVGIVMELLKESHGGIVVHRNVDAIANALLRLKGRPEIVARMGKANRKEVVKNWQWKDRVQAYGPMFEKMLEGVPKQPVFSLAPTVSVIMTNFNKKASIQQSVKALAAAARKYGLDKVEFIFQDEGSTDGSDKVEIDTTAFQSVRRVTTAKWQEYRISVARNRAAGFARGDIIQFLDPDIVLPENYLVAMAGKVAAEPHALHIGHIKYVAPSDMAEKDVPVRGDWQGRYEEMNKPWFACSAGVLAITHEAWDEIGGFDLRYDGAWGVEDVDFAHTAHEKGYPLRIHKDIRPVHVEHSSTYHGKNERNAALYEKKWGEKIV